MQNTAAGLRLQPNRVKEVFVQAPMVKRANHPGPMLWLQPISHADVH
jgi:hypothetical protein